jgi:hypothetical protein
MKIRENLEKKHERGESDVVTNSTNPRYDRHQLCPSGWISERLVMAMCFDVIFESDI